MSKRHCRPKRKYFAPPRWKKAGKWYVYHQRFITIAPFDSGYRSSDCVKYSCNKSRAWELLEECESTCYPVVRTHQDTRRRCLENICLAVVMKNPQLSREMIQRGILADRWSTFFYPQTVFQACWIKNYPEWRGGQNPKPKHRKTRNKRHLIKTNME
jgi:hypothetical protein